MPYFQIFILLACVWLIGRIFQRFNWPAIFGEIMAGVILGPVLLGVVETSEAISILAEMGIFFLMLHAGIVTDPAELYKASKRSVFVALGGALLPFAVGSLVSFFFGYSLEQAMFIGVSLSISSIAVSAKLFKENNLTNSRMAHVTMGAAIVDDVIGLILFSMVLNIAEHGTVELLSLFLLIGKIAAFFGLVVLFGSKYYKSLRKIIYEGNKGFTFTIIVALGFGVLAEFMGLHIIVGAFLAGLFIREEIIEPGLYNKIEDRVYGLAYSFLGPIFFASLAFHLNFSALNTALLFTLAIIVVAIVTKVVGAGFFAYFTKMSRVESLGIGLAMNSRGAVELIIAVIGLERGIINEEIFSIMILMAFVTTIVSIAGLKYIKGRFCVGDVR